MKVNFLALFLIGLILSSCVKEDFDQQGNLGRGKGLAFKLYEASYDNEATRLSNASSSSSYDRLEYYIMDQDGNVVPNIKTMYIPESSEIVAEGLHVGNYELLVLGIRGDYQEDKITINTLNKTSDTWLSFPEKIEKPLVAEYFHSYTPFTVELRKNEDGTEEEVAILKEQILQKRIVSCVDFTFDYNNPYVKTSVLDNQIQFVNAKFSKSLSGKGEYSGETIANTITVAGSSEGAVCLFPETATALKGTIDMVTRSYEKDKTYKRSYAFKQQEVKRNYKNDVRTNVVHPNDKSGFMFITTRAYDGGNHGKILQDDEPKEIYADEKQRKFNTAQPLQVKINNEGQLHVRFYSPRGLSDVTLLAKIPSTSEDYLEIAYFDTIPPFADFYEAVPFLRESKVFRTEDGRMLELPPVQLVNAQQAEWKVESGCAYWRKLTGIQYGWDISFDLYGGDPDRPDGGPKGNWMGIRPVHCRESVAFFLNYTYLLGLPEIDVLIKENAHRLHDNAGKPVPADRILTQMRTKRSLRTGLIYGGNGIAGLGGGSTWGVVQYIYFDHYVSTYSCGLAFHEIGHVMGYGHSSSFTYGPWANELMNNFYVKNVKDFPIDSRDYLDSWNNPHRYK